MRWPLTYQNNEQDFLCRALGGGGRLVPRESERNRDHSIVIPIHIPIVGNPDYPDTRVLSSELVLVGAFIEGVDLVSHLVVRGLLAGPLVCFVIIEAHLQIGGLFHVESQLKPLVFSCC